MGSSVKVFNIELDPNVQCINKVNKVNKPNESRFQRVQKIKLEKLLTTCDG